MQKISTRTLESFYACATPAAPAQASFLWQACFLGDQRGWGGRGRRRRRFGFPNEYLKTSASQNMFENSTSQNSRHSAALPPSLAPGDAEQHRHRLSAVGLSSTCLSSTSHFVSSSPTPCSSLTRQPSESRSSKPKSVTKEVRE